MLELDSGHTTTIHFSTPLMLKCAGCWNSDSGHTTAIHFSTPLDAEMLDTVLDVGTLIRGTQITPLDAEMLDTVGTLIQGTQLPYTFPSPLMLNVVTRA